MAVALTIAKMVPLVLFAVVGLAFVDWSRLAVETTPAGHRFGEAALLLLFAYAGFENTPSAAAEYRNPQRDVPRGILASLGIVTVLYVAVAIVLSGMVSYKQLKTVGGHGQANLATAFTANGIHWASKIISIGALAGLTTVVMVLLPTFSAMGAEAVPLATAVPFTLTVAPGVSTVGVMVVLPVALGTERV